MEIMKSWISWRLRSAMMGSVLLREQYVWKRRRAWGTASLAVALLRVLRQLQTSQEATPSVGQGLSIQICRYRHVGKNCTCSKTHFDHRPLLMASTRMCISSSDVQGRLNVPRSLTFFVYSALKQLHARSHFSVGILSSQRCSDVSLLWGDPRDTQKGEPSLLVRRSKRILEEMGELRRILYGSQYPKPRVQAVQSLTLAVVLYIMASGFLQYHLKQALWRPK
jgi:hypothetical protein